MHRIRVSLTGSKRDSGHFQVSRALVMIGPQPRPFSSIRGPRRSIPLGAFQTMHAMMIFKSRISKIYLMADVRRKCSLSPRPVPVPVSV
ncbi:Uncharacterized protein HZ326_5647 [Fusarium oxysporum f. sp. albedinis]|nr:Uncharacterized protein HZ326_5647 [Fusarium oxysporum f. sp. albedinis]